MRAIWILTSNGLYNVETSERLRRFEMYGDGHSHPSEEPRRQQASVLVFHMADMDSCDASYAVVLLNNIWTSSDYLLYDLHSAVHIFYELFETYQVRMQPLECPRRTYSFIVSYRLLYILFRSSNGLPSRAAA
jgi:hypothetical protein